jgi:hypothetical protein
MEILYKFQFSRGEIFEVKYTDLPKTTSKNERFKWFINLDGQESLLEFVSMTSTTRNFRLNDTVIHLDIEVLNINIGDDKYVCF